MLTKAELIQLFDVLGTPTRGRELILSARAQAPVRDVQSRGDNVLTALASTKMAREIYTESRTIEFPAAVLKEHDPAVLEYYAQPTKLSFELVDHATGEIRNITHYPDFLVITENGFTLEEWKSEVKLAKLAERYPYRYVKGNDNNWYAPQIEEQLSRLGIGYRIQTDAQLPGKFIENTLHLADYHHAAAEPCPETELTRLHLALKAHGSLYLAELFTAPFNFNSDHILKAIADGLVVADLYREVLSQPRRARVYRDAILRDFLAGHAHQGKLPGQEVFTLTICPGTTFTYEGQELTIQLVGDENVICSPRIGPSITLSRSWLEQAHEQRQITCSAPSKTELDLSGFTQEQLAEGLRRKAILDGCNGVEVSERTRRRWQARQAAAAANGGNEVVAIVPRISARGNRTPRLTDEQLALMDEVINEHWRTNRAVNYAVCHQHLLVRCADAQVKAPSYPALIHRIKSAQTDHDVRARLGKRMTYQQSAFVDVLSHDSPAHGSRPFQYVHIDHTQLDIELISSRSGKPLGRPWFSLAVDSFSRRVVGIYLTFDPPSYHSVMMVLRDIVRRHQRLPEFIVTDNGKDFDSAAFKTFLQVMGVHLRFRPAGRPRHGAVLERLFGVLNTQYIHNLAGNTKVTKNVRMTTGKHMPVNFAEWTLETMYWGIEHWAFEYYDQKEHPTLECSPRYAFQRGQKESGSRPHKQVLLTRDFLIATCPPVDRSGVRKVNRQSGVKVHDLFYWHPEMRDPRIAGKQLPVRFDPWDASSVYVRFEERWIHATCRALVGMGQLTDRERRALTDEYIRRKGTLESDERSSQRLREFLKTHTPSGAEAYAFERQAENKALYNQLQFGCITPVTRKPFACLEQDISETSTTEAAIRTENSIQPEVLSEAAAPEPMPDFDVF